MSHIEPHLVSDKEANCHEVSLERMRENERESETERRDCVALTDLVLNLQVSFRCIWWLWWHGRGSTGCCGGFAGKLMAQFLIMKPGNEAFWRVTATGDAPEKLDAIG